MAMIENEETRQRAAYATSISTLDSTDESLHNSDSEYDADDILAQRVHDGDNEGVVQYLVKYTDYPMHRLVAILNLASLSLYGRNIWQFGLAPIII